MSAKLLTKVIALFNCYISLVLYIRIIRDTDNFYSYLGTCAFLSKFGIFSGLKPVC